MMKKVSQSAVPLPWTSSVVVKMLLVVCLLLVVVWPPLVHVEGLAGKADHFMDIDTNGDGQIDHDEVLEYFGTEFDSTDWYSVMDRNRDNKISHAEYLGPKDYDEL